MKYLLILPLFLIGCGSMQHRPVTGGMQKKMQVKACVIELINEDVQPMEAAKICDGIYRRRPL